MCVSIHASEMRATKIYAGEAIRDGKYVHVLSYQNEAVSLSSGPNAMILPIPAVGELGPKNAIDTRQFPKFIGDIAETTKLPTLGFGGKSLRSEAQAAQVFDVGNYTVALGSSIWNALEACLSIPQDKRPTGINPEIVSNLAKLYKDWSFAICCWKGDIKPEPLLWWFEPKYPHVLFAPGLDAHDGNPPLAGSPVPVDTIITFGSTLKPTGFAPIRYSGKIPTEVASLLPTYAVGQKINSLLLNGDYSYPTANFTGTVGWDTLPSPALRVFPEWGSKGSASTLKELTLNTWH